MASAPLPDDEFELYAAPGHLVRRLQQIEDGRRNVLQLTTAGVDHLQLRPRPGQTTDAIIEQADRFIDQVVPHVEDLWAPGPLPPCPVESS